jgi:hypothetical protein
MQMNIIVTIYMNKVEGVDCYSRVQDAGNYYYTFVEENYREEMLEDGVEDDYRSIMEHAEQHMVERDSRIEWWMLNETTGKYYKVDPKWWDWPD